MDGRGLAHNIVGLTCLDGGSKQDTNSQSSTDALRPDERLQVRAAAFAQIFETDEEIFAGQLVAFRSYSVRLGIGGS